MTRFQCVRAIWCSRNPAAKRQKIRLKSTRTVAGRGNGWSPAVTSGAALSKRLLDTVSCRGSETASPSRSPPVPCTGQPTEPPRRQARWPGQVKFWSKRSVVERKGAQTWPNARLFGTCGFSLNVHCYCYFVFCYLTMCINVCVFFQYFCSHFLRRKILLR